MSRTSIDKVKEDIQELETASVHSTALKSTDTKWYSRFLKKDPTPEFLEQVAIMNQEVLDEAEVKRLRRKLDLMILPALAICYAFYYVDKTTLSYAAIFGIRKDLNLKKAEYSWLSSLFYWGWVAWAVPTNILMQKFPLAKYLAVNIFFWGVLLMCQAASRNFAELAVLRIISGAFEATADPAFVLMTSTWYTRNEQPVRIGGWYSANGFGIAFGGILGYGIGHIKTHLPAWKWEFIIIGLLCTVWAIFMFFVIPDSPFTARHFTPRERLILASRKRHDQASAESRAFKWYQVRESLMDVKLYLFFLFGLTANIPNGGTSNYGTLVVAGFGFDTLQTTLMQIPYGIIIASIIGICVWVNSLSFAQNSRTLLMAFVTVPTVIGFALMVWSPSKAGRLVGYWMTGSSNAVFVLGLSLVSGNVAGTTKKSLMSASVFLGVAIGNIIGPFMFKESEAPIYRTGIIGCMCSRAAEIVVILALRYVFLSANKRRDKDLAEGRVKYDDRAHTEDITDWENLAFRYVA